MARGSLSIARKVGLWSRTQSVQMHAAAVAVGIVAGVLATHVKLHMGLPGHKALFWMIPLVATRLTCGCRLGTVLGSSSAAATTMLLGGRLAGGPAMAFLIVLAGGLLDGAAALAESRRLSAWAALPLLGLAGLLGNLLCMGKRLANSTGDYLVFLGLDGFLAVAASYALFGLAGGLIGGAVGLIGRRVRRRRGL